MKGLIQGHVTVGTVTSVAAFDLPGLLASFHQQHPGVRITLSEGTSSQLVADLHGGRLDLIVTGATAAAARDTAPPGVTARVVADEPPGSGLRACLEEACAEAGFRPYVAFESTDPRMLGQLAAAGLGLAVLSESGARARTENLRVVRLSDSTARARLLLAWRNDEATSPAARALIAHARTSLPSPLPGD